MPTNLAPTSELVAVAYLRTMNLGPSATFGVGTTLPEDTSKWKDGFVTVAVVGGVTDPDVPTRRPLIQFDCWIPSISTDKPSWGRANVLAENIVEAFYAAKGTGTYLDLPNAYRNAQVQSVYLEGEPRRIVNDPAGHARYTFDAVVTWTASKASTP